MPLEMGYFNYQKTFNRRLNDLRRFWEIFCFGGSQQRAAFMPQAA